MVLGNNRYGSPFSLTLNERNGEDMKVNVDLAYLISRLADEAAAQIKYIEAKGNGVNGKRALPYYNGRLTAFNEILNLKLK